MTRGTDAHARLLVLLSTLAFVLVAAPATVHAETIQVDSRFDAPLVVGAGCMSSQGCTLRAAIQYATANSDTDDVIFVPANDYQLTVTSGNFDPEFGDLDAQAAGSLDDETLAIIGAGPRTTRILGLTGTFEERVLENNSPNLAVNISGVTIAGGRQLGSGGGIASFGPLAVTNSTITGNSVEHRDGSEAQGGGIYTQAGVSVTNSAITNNSATTENSDNQAQGGGIYNGSGPSVILNSTIAGNFALDDDAGGTEASGGGVFNGSATMSFHFATLARNTTDGEGGGISGASGVTFGNTIVALNRTSAGAADNCSPASPFTSQGHNLEEGTDCGFTGSGDRRSANPLLGTLANNGGFTNTLALLAGSPAIDAANSLGCPGVDQRGVTRPSGAGCDIGAFEFGSSILPPPPPPPPPPEDDALPPPRLGRTVNVREVSGRVYYAIPPRATTAGVRASQKGLRFRPLREARQLPVRSFLNTRRGSVRLTAARPRAGKTQSGVFSSGLFQILQSRKKRAKGLTELRLKGSSFRRCKPRARKPGKRAQAAISRRRIRRLRARGRGRFRTRGRYSAATVRGTKWLTQDRCDGTLTKVTQGRVAVRDFRRKRTIVLKRGKRYLAKARSRG